MISMLLSPVIWPPKVTVLPTSVWIEPISSSTSCSKVLKLPPAIKESCSGVTKWPVTTRSPAATRFKGPSEIRLLPVSRINMLPAVDIRVNPSSLSWLWASFKIRPFWAVTLIAPPTASISSTPVVNSPTPSTSKIWIASYSNENTPPILLAAISRPVIDKSAVRVTSPATIPTLPAPRPLIAPSASSVTLPCEVNPLVIPRRSVVSLKTYWLRFWAHAGLSSSRKLAS